jgi:hypothetical protein
MPIVIETFREFVERQGCPYFQTNQGVLFENGAHSDGQQYHRDPPEDERPRLAAKGRFFKAVIEHEEKMFEAAKTRALNAGNAYMVNPTVSPGVGPETVEQLKQGKARIESLREQLAKIQLLFETQPDEAAKIQRREEQERFNSQARSRQRDVLNEILKIEV